MGRGLTVAPHASGIVMTQIKKITNILVEADTIRVKALRQHLNRAGSHLVGDEYEIDRLDGERLIARGLVEAVVTALSDEEHVAQVAKFATVGAPAPRTAPANKRRPKAPGTKN